jgi:protein-S-isoprenylcysteine O-methyltransferase Ste14
MDQQHRDTMPAWAALALKIVDGVSFEAPGKKILKVCHTVNFHKIFTAFLILGMMYAYDNWSTGAWVYLALHGVYGYCWLIKDFGFRDHQLEAGISILGTIGLYVGLIGLYWIIPWLFISRHIEPTSFQLFFAIVLHTIGVVTMIAADCQRHFTLKFRQGLISGGMFRYTRNPNYFGEVLLYSAYAYLASHWLAWLLIAYMTFIAFLPRLYRKDVSLSRHPGWAAYKARTGLLVPWGLFNGRAFIDLFRSDGGRGKDSTRSGQAA